MADAGLHRIVVSVTMTLVIVGGCADDEDPHGALRWQWEVEQGNFRDYDGLAAAPNGDVLVSSGTVADGHSLVRVTPDNEILWERDTSGPVRDVTPDDEALLVGGGAITFVDPEGGFDTVETGASATSEIVAALAMPTRVAVVGAFYEGGNLGDGLLDVERSGFLVIYDRSGALVEHHLFDADAPASLLRDPAGGFLFRALLPSGDLDVGLGPVGPDADASVRVLVRFDEEAVPYAQYDISRLGALQGPLTLGDDGAMYFTGGRSDEILVRTDEAGQIDWRVTTDDVDDMDVRSVAVLGDVLYAVGLQRPADGLGAGLLASFRADGLVRWQREIDHLALGTPLVATSTGLFLVESNYVEDEEHGSTTAYPVLTARDDGGK